MTALGVPEHFLDEPEEEEYDPSNSYSEETEEERKDKIKYYIG